MDPRTDDELVVAIGHDASAFTEFYRRHSWRILGFTLRRSQRPDEVADLVSAVFLQVIESASRFDPAKGRALPWLFGVAANVVASERRRSSRAAEVGTRISGRRFLQPDDYERLEERLDAESESRRLFAAMGQLPPAERDLLCLVALDGLTTPEAAQALGIRQVTARMRLSRARRRMRQLIGAEPHTGGQPLAAVSGTPSMTLLNSTTVLPEARR